MSRVPLKTGIRVAVVSPVAQAVEQALQAAGITELNGVPISQIFGPGGIIRPGAIGQTYPEFMAAGGKNLCPDSNMLNGGAYWTFSGLSIEDGTGPLGGNSLVLAGIGAASGAQTSWSAPIPVTVGTVMCVSGEIDATYCTVNAPTWSVMDAGRTTTYATASGILGKLARVAKSFTVGSGVTSVVVVASSANTTITNGQLLKFSDPQFEVGAQPSNYIPTGLDASVLPNIVGTTATFSATAAGWYEIALSDTSGYSDYRCAFMATASVTTGAAQGACEFKVTNDSTGANAGLTQVQGAPAVPITQARVRKDGSNHTALDIYVNWTTGAIVVQIAIAPVTGAWNGVQAQPGLAATAGTVVYTLPLDPANTGGNGGGFGHIGPGGKWHLLTDSGDVYHGGAHVLDNSQNFVPGLDKVLDTPEGTYSKTRASVQTNNVPDLSKGILNKTANYITYTAGGTVDSLKPQEAGANVTETRTSALTKSLSTHVISDNKVQNGNFVNGLTDWTFPTGWFPGVSSGLPVGSTYAGIQNTSVVSTILGTVNIPIDFTKTYLMECWVYCTSAAATHYIGFAEYNSSGNLVQHVPAGADYGYALLAGTTLPAGTYKYLSAEVSGNGGTSPSTTQFNASAASVVPFLQTNYNQTANVSQIAIVEFRISEVAAGSRRGLQSTTPGAGNYKAYTNFTDNTSGGHVGKNLFMLPSPDANGNYIAQFSTSQGIDDAGLSQQSKWGGIPDIGHTIASHNLTGVVQPSLPATSGKKHIWASDSGGTPYETPIFDTSFGHSLMTFQNGATASLSATGTATQVGSTVVIPNPNQAVNFSASAFIQVNQNAATTAFQITGFVRYSVNGGSTWTNGINGYANFPTTTADIRSLACGSTNDYKGTPSGDIWVQFMYQTAAGAGTFQFTNGTLTIDVAPLSPAVLRGGTLVDTLPSTGTASGSATYPATTASAGATLVGGSTGGVTPITYSNTRTGNGSGTSDGGSITSGATASIFTMATATLAAGTYTGVYSQTATDSTTPTAQTSTVNCTVTSTISQVYSAISPSIQVTNGACSTGGSSGTCTAAGNFTVTASGGNGSYTYSNSVYSYDAGFSTNPTITTGATASSGNYAGAAATTAFPGTSLHVTLQTSVNDTRGTGAQTAQGTGTLKYTV